MLRNGCAPTLCPANKHGKRNEAEKRRCWQYFVIEQDGDGSGQWKHGNIDITCRLS